MFWNLENFFDYMDEGTGESDTEFSPDGDRHWTRKRFYAKCNAVAKTILWMKEKYGKLPDAVGFAEVENRFVLNSLVWSTALKKLDYKIVHYDSPDPRGIDVALLYRSSVFSQVSSKACKTDSCDAQVFTRDILLVRLDGDLCVLVNHLPSKYGGVQETEGKRSLVVGRLRGLADSLLSVGCGSLVAIGDFNDSPEKAVFGRLDSVFVNEALPLYEKGQWSIRYGGKGELIDMAFVSKDIADASRMEIVHPPFLTVRDTAHSYEKPLRTYSGPRYLGGVSDHCPIVLIIYRR